MTIYSMKFSRAITGSHQRNDISSLMTVVAEADLETSVLYGHLRQLIPREDFIEFSRCGGYRACIMTTYFQTHHS
jgi:hypothetical protein